MIVKEYCRYVRSYSELEGLQQAHSLCYSARRTEEGILLELELRQGKLRQVSRVLCPGGPFAPLLRLTRYLCENGVGPEQWLEMLEDLHQPYRLLGGTETPQTPENAEIPENFVAFV